MRSIACMRLAGVVGLTLLISSCSLGGLGTPRGCSADELRAKSVTNPYGLDRMLCRAAMGDREAQFRLGQIYETGDDRSKFGGPVIAADAERAAGLYKSAATATSGQTPIYMAPVGNQKYGTVMNVQTGTASAGHAGAQYRLGLLYLEGRGVGQSDRKARKWMRRAARQNHPDAARYLQTLEPAEIGGY